MKFKGLNQESDPIDIGAADATVCINTDLERTLAYKSPRVTWSNSVNYNGHTYAITAGGLVTEDGIRLGVPGPSLPPTLTAAAGGSFPAATYDVLTTYYDSRGKEGVGSAKATVTTTANQKVTITWDTADVPTQATVRIYSRGGNDNVGDYSLIKAVTPGDAEYPGGSYEWTTGTIDPTNGIYTSVENYQPPSAGGGLLAVFNSILFVSQGPDLYYSRTGAELVHAFPPGNKHTFEGDVNGLALLNSGTLCAGTTDSIHNISGYDFHTLTFDRAQVYANEGPNRKRTFLPVAGGIMYQASDGVRFFNGNSSELVSERARDLFIGLASRKTYNSDTETYNSSTQKYNETEKWGFWDGKYYELEAGIGYYQRGQDWMQFTNGITGFRYKTKDFLYTGLPQHDPNRILIDYSNQVTVRVYHDATAQWSNTYTSTTRTQELFWLPSGLWERLSIEFDGATNCKLYAWGFKEAD